MSHLIPIYAVWDGNAEAMAADIEELAVTVRQWRNRGSIPPKYWPKIISQAKLRGTKLELSQFLPTPASEISSGHGGASITPLDGGSATGQSSEMSGEFRAAGEAA